MQDILPAKKILNRRHIEPTTFYDLCGADMESIRHILTKCTVAKVFWQAVKLLTGAKTPRLHPNT